MDRIKPVSPFLTLLLATTLAGCGGSGDAPAGEPDAAGSAEPAAAQGSTEDPAALAARGEELFKGKGCNACHTFGGGRLVGPDLVGVTERRNRSWITSMIMSPDSMLRNDTTAKRLLGEYYTPMQDVGVTTEQAGAIYHYLRRQTEQAGSAGP